jgi:hypothetical protein
MSRMGGTQMKGYSFIREKEEGTNIIHDNTTTSSIDDQA